MRHLIIKHFGPLTEVEIELKRVTLLIGPQSSGKSTVLKVACFCDWLERRIEMTQAPEMCCNLSAIHNNLIAFHRLEGFMKDNSYLSYESDAMSFSYDAKKRKFDFAWKKGGKRWAYKRAKIAYCPAERNLLASIPNWYQISMENNNILSFMKEWEFARKSFTKKENIIGLPFDYKYNPEDSSDLIVLPDGKELKLTNASSGLQSLTPLFVMIKYLTGGIFKKKYSNVEDAVLKDHLEQVVQEFLPSREKCRKVVNGIMELHHTDMFIEEPEAHLFPSTQKEFVYVLADLLNGNSRRKHTCVIATHSPYLMTAFNNLIQAGETASASKENNQKVAERFPVKRRLRFDDVAAFSMKDGKAESIMDDDFKMISAEDLDSASREISDDFNFLLEI